MLVLGIFLLGTLVTSGFCYLEVRDLGFFFFRNLICKSLSVWISRCLGSKHKYLWLGDKHNLPVMFSVNLDFFFLALGCGLMGMAHVYVSSAGNFRWVK